MAGLTGADRRGQPVKEKIRLTDIGRADRQLVTLEATDLMLLPGSLGKETEPLIGLLTENQREKFDTSLDGVVALGMPKPKTKEEEEALVGRFLGGLEKLLSSQDNWTFL
jgi:hypothetical protein